MTDAGDEVDDSALACCGAGIPEEAGAEGSHVQEGGGVTNAGEKVDDSALGAGTRKRRV